MNTSANNLCIIPARGGSKRIPRKNIKDFLGKPVVAYSIEAALRSNLFEKVMVSTDDDEVAAVARTYGAEVPFKRSAANADDFATTLDVLKEVIEQYQIKGITFSCICCIYPTAPFVTSEKLMESFRLLEENKFDSVLPVIKYSFPIQRSFKQSDNGRIEYRFEEYKNARSQDLESTFHDAGQFYWMTRDIILNKKSIVTFNTGAIEITELEGQDIDTITDWKLAELKYELLQGLK